MNTRAKKVRGSTPRRYDALTEPERRDIVLWFAWGGIYGYPTGPRDYLRAMLKPDMRARFLDQPRPLRKLILRFVIDEARRRAVPPCPVPLP